MLVKNPIQPKVKSEKTIPTSEKKSGGGLFSVKTDLKPTTPNTGVTPLVTPAPRKRKYEDDSFEVAKNIKELFVEYEGIFKVVTSEDELIKFIENRPELGFDTETTGLDRYHDEIAGFSLGDDVECIYVPLNHRRGKNYEGDWKRMGEILRGGGRKYWGHNSKFDRGMMIVHVGFDMPIKWDSELAARLIDNRDEAKLKALYIKYIDPYAKFYEYKSLFKQPFTYYDPVDVGVYAGVDAIKHYKLGAFQENLLRTKFPKSYRLMKNVELPLLDVVLDMELRGIAIDKPYYAEFTAQLRKEMDDCLAEIQRDFPGFNPNSPKQVGEILFDRLRLPDYSKKRQTGKEYLEQMNHPIPKLILQYRTLSKHISTYTEAIPNLAIQDEEGNWIVHTTYHTIGADTGRFSSSDPNLQNQPKDDRFRRGFIARPGHKLVSADFSQQEQAVLAGGSQDPKMLEGANNGKDYYALMASIIWDLPYDDCTKKGCHKDLRNKCKSIVLGVTYGMSAKSLSEKLNVDDPSHHYTTEECENILKKFYAGFPLVKEFQEECAEFGESHGYMTTVLGRRRYFRYLGRPKFECIERPEVADTLNSLKYYNQIRACLDECKREGIHVIDNRYMQQEELRQTCNHYCQGCLHGDTEIFVEGVGLTKISEMVGKHIRLLDGEGNFTEGDVAYSGKKRLCKIHLKSGHTILCSDNHKFAYPEFRGGRDFLTPPQIQKELEQSGICRIEFNHAPHCWDYGVGKFEGIDGTAPNSKNLSLNDFDNYFELGQFLGRVASDGSVFSGDGGGNYVTLLGAEHELDVGHYFEKILPKSWGVKLNIYETRNGRNQSMWDITIYSKRLASELSNLGIKDHRIAPKLFKNSELLRGYLCGLFDGDGTNYNGHQRFTQGSHGNFGQFFEQLRSALYLFGIRSRIFKRRDGAHLLDVYTHCIKDFEEQIGFISEKKQAEYGYRTALTKNVQYGRSEKVKSVEITDEFVDMYDVLDTDNGYFMADGVITHNSAADQTKVCMIAIFRDEDFRNKYHGRLLLQIHDEVIAEFPDEFAEEGGKHMAKIMSEVGSEVIGARIWCEPSGCMDHWSKDA